MPVRTTVTAGSPSTHFRNSCAALVTPSSVATGGNGLPAARSIIEPFRFIPPIAWIPLAIIFFSGLPRFAFLIFLGAFFPIYTATHVGVSRVEPIHRKVYMVHGASKFQILTQVVVPTVLPDIFGGMRVAMGAAWLTIVAAELTGGTSVGLGRMMVDYAELLPGLLGLDAGRFYLALASEPDRPAVLARIRAHLRPGQRIFVGVTDPIDPAVETAEHVRDRVLEAAGYIPLEQLGTTDDCGFAPFADDTSTARATVSNVRASSAS